MPVPRLFRWLFAAPRPGGPRASWAMAVCAAVAVLLWVALTLQKPNRATFTAPLAVTSVGQGRALVEAPPPDVIVTAEGAGFRLLPLLARPPQIGVSAQSDKVALLDAVGPLGAGVRVVNVVPSTLDLSTAPVVSRRLPIALHGRLGFAPTFDLADSVRLFPDSITVTGAEPVLDGLRAWPTAPVALGGLRDTARLDVPLSDTLAGLVSFPTRVVRLVVPVAAFTGAEREVEVRVRGLPPGAARLTPDPATLRVRFRVRLGQYEAAMRALDFYADVSYNELVASSSGRVFPRLHLPAGLALRDVVASPQTVGYYTVVE